MTTVLFVDDEPNVLAALRRSLSAYRNRWDMRFVESAPAALQSMADEAADVIVADFRMPGMDGGQLLATVRERWPDTGRLMLSGHTDQQDLIEVMSVAQTFLDKPCDRDVLVAAVERSLRLRDTLAGKSIRAEIGALDLLPATDSALDELQAVLDAPDSDDAAIARVVERDIGLTVKVLQLANSSFFGDAGAISSVPDALRIVGQSTVRSVALLRGLAAPVHAAGLVSSDWVGRVNASAGLTARIAVDLVRPEDAQEAFCAALLQECGQLVFAACRPEELTRVLAEHARGRATAEADAFGATHASVGAYLLSLWGFPEHVVDAVAAHDLVSDGERSAPLSVRRATEVARLVAEERYPSTCLSATSRAAEWHRAPASSHGGWVPYDLDAGGTP